MAAEMPQPPLAANNPRYIERSAKNILLGRALARAGFWGALEMASPSCGQGWRRAGPSQFTSGSRMSTPL